VGFIKLRACGKINWVLDVLSKRSDGYHEVEMIMQSVDLCDIITITDTNNGITLDSNWDFIPRDKNNLAYRAAEMMKNSENVNRGADIFLYKRIPAAAGMGGGSADAAAVLLGLNRLWRIGKSDAQLIDMAVSLGADVPFFILGGTALAHGIGEKLTPLDPLEDVWILLVKPDFGVSTAHVYGNLDLREVMERPDTKGMLNVLEQKDLKGISDYMCNVLEQVVIKMHPEVEEIKREMRLNGALGSLMSGSGPIVYGLFESHKISQICFHRLSKSYPQCFLTRTSRKSINIIEELE